MLETIQKSPDVYEWFINDWVRLVSIDPETRKLYLFEGGTFVPYKPLAAGVQSVGDVTPLIESTQDNLPVYSLSNRAV